MALTPGQLGNLIDSHWGPLRSWIGFCAGAEDDILQDAFIRLAAQDPPPDRPVAWLYSVTRNLAINERKSRWRRRRRQQAVAETRPPATWAPDQLESEELIENLSQLEDEHREVVVARIWGGLKFDEIATLLDSSPATVWRRYQDALSQLREIYGVTCPTPTD